MKLGGQVRILLKKLPLHTNVLMSLGIVGLHATVTACELLLVTVIALGYRD